MRTLNFSIYNVNAIDSYLYAGNLYVFFENGRIAYVSFSLLVKMLQDSYPAFANLFDLAFLHNDYIDTPEAKMLLGINGVLGVIQREWRKAQKEVCFSLPFNKIEKYFYNIGEWTSIPLDVRLYAMRLFIGCEDGLYESIIRQDDKAKVEASKIDKTFDSKVVSVNAKYGVIAISADKEGLFSSYLINENEHIKVGEYPNVEGVSLRTDWKDDDIISYDQHSRFKYIHNTSSRTNKLAPFYHKLRSGGEYKRIDQFAIQVDNMDPLFEELDINSDDLSYCFNSGSSAFLRLKNGTFFTTDFKQRSGGNYKKTIKEIKGCKKIMSSAIVPSGCVLRYYDKVILYKGGEAFSLCDCPSYGVRSFLNSNRYRSLLSINTEESIFIHSTESFSPMVQQEDMSKYGRVRYANLFRLDKKIQKKLAEEKDDLPF